jgi:hypothetical protein
MNNIRSHKSLTNKLLQYLGVIAALLLLGAIIFYGFFSQPYAFEDGEVKLDCLTNITSKSLSTGIRYHIFCQ